MPRNLPKALREARTAPGRRDLVYRGAVAARDALRLLEARITNGTGASIVGTVLLIMGAVIWVSGAWIVGPSYLAAGIAALFIHGEIKRRR